VICIGRLSSEDVDHAVDVGQITLAVAIISELTSSIGKLSFLNTSDDALVFFSLENISQAVPGKILLPHGTGLDSRLDSFGIGAEKVWSKSIEASQHACEVEEHVVQSCPSEIVAMAHETLCS
jgi:hypothetical protein